MSSILTIRATPWGRAGRVATALLAAALGGCGGGGSPEPPAWSGVTIEAPTEAATFTTDQPTVDLAGRSFVPAGSVCDGIVGTIADGYRVRWRNAADGSAGPAGALRLNCLLAVSLTWEAAELPLAQGDNAITVTATAADGEAGRDTITVRRVADTTAPAVTSSTPPGGSVIAGGLTPVQVDFTEPVLALSGSFTLHDETAGVPLALTPLRTGVSVDLGNLALASGHDYVLRVSGVLDRGGNAMVGEFVARFSTAP